MMKENISNGLIERYLYDVVKRLPEKQRADIEQELRTLIEDMVEERAESSELDREECETSVLNELGDPQKLAKSYRGDSDSLISGEYYDRYCFILKIVLICTGAGMLISHIISTVVDVIDTEVIAESIIRGSVNMGINIPSAILNVFAIITLVFAVMQRYNVKIDLEEGNWTVESLPQIPYKKAVISRGESAAGIVFGILVAVLFSYQPQLMGVWIKQNDVMVSVPVFNLAIWYKALPFFLIGIMVGIISDFVKLVVGRYNYKVMITTIVTDVVGIIMTFIFFTIFPILNENFIPEFQKATGDIMAEGGAVLAYLGPDHITKVILVFIFLCYLIDIGSTIYYTVKYGNKE